MADFQASFTDPTLGVQVYGQADVVYATDSSNYTTNSEDGHALADFTLYRRLKLLMPDATERIFSSVPATGEVAFDPAATASTFLSTFDTADFGDWHYTVTLYSVPTYDAAVAYATGDCVYVNGSGLYKALQATTGNAPAASPTYWLPITDPDDLSSKYIAIQQWSVTYDIEVGWMRTVAEANRDTTGRDLKLLPNNLKFLTALKLNMLLDAVGDLTEVSDWTGVELCISQAKEILNDDSLN